METLRATSKWISRHGILTLILCALLVAGVVFARTVIDRTQGTVTDPIRRGEIVDAVYGIGTVTATRSYSIKPGVISRISDLFVQEGDSVRRGAKLAEIDQVIYKAPFDGVINFLPFKVGENIFTQLPILVLTDLRDRYLVASLEQQGALRVRPGQKAKLSFDSIRNETFEGVVQSVYSYHSNFLARIDVPGLPSEILPDMTADIAIIIREVKDALLIPVAAYENGSVWVKRGHGIPILTPVTLGVVDGAMAEVASGNLNVGDTLMVRRKIKP